MENSTLALDLEFAEKYGYDFIEIRMRKMRAYIGERSLKELVAFFEKNRIKPYAFNTLEYVTFRDVADYKKIKEDLVFLCETGSKIGCHYTVVVPSFDVTYTRGRIKEETVSVLKDLSDVAEKYDMNLAFEFVGYPNCSVNTLEQAYEIVETVNRKNVGLVLDCFHFYAMHSRIETLKHISPDKIFIFHINDTNDFPVGALRDHHRVWPGDGVIDLDQILSTLKGIGYDRMASIEVFNQDYYELPPEKAIRVGKEKMTTVLRKHFSIPSE